MRTHFGDAGQHFEVRCDRNARACPRRPDGLDGAGGAVDVEADLDHALDHALDLLLRSRSPALQRSCVHFPVSVPSWPFGRDAELIFLQRAHHVDDALVDVGQFDIGQRPVIGGAHILEDDPLAVRLVDRQAVERFSLPIS